LTALPHKRARLALIVLAACAACSGGCLPDDAILSTLASLLTNTVFAALGQLLAA